MWLAALAITSCVNSSYYFGRTWSVSYAVRSPPLCSEKRENPHRQGGWYVYGLT
jgi:hypothetical protein